MACQIKVREKRDKRDKSSHVPACRIKVRDKRDKRDKSPSHVPYADALRVGSASAKRFLDR
jgi:hypothetical protein